MTKNTITRYIKIHPQSRVIASILAFIFIGTLLVAFSRAASPTASIEAENVNNTVAGCASRPSGVTNASGDGAVKFGCTTEVFKHPGIGNSKAQLDFIKTKIGQEPWLTAYNQMASNGLASINYTPATPLVELKCTTSNPSLCNGIRSDSAAVYTQALMWYFTGNQAYANKAIQIMNNWSSTLSSVSFSDADTTNKAYWQNRLEIGWSAETMIRGAELIRYSNAGWQTADITKFEGMLKNIYVQHLKYGWTRGANDSMTWANGLINVGIFTNDKTTYDQGVQAWKDVLASAVYLNRDGAQPPYFPITTDSSTVYLQEIGATKRNIPPAGGTIRTPDAQLARYYSPTSYIEGLQIESGRDMGHVMMGVGSLATAAETARIQGYDDLYNSSGHKERLLAAYELNARYINEMLDAMTIQNFPITYAGLTNFSTTTWIPSSPFPFTNFTTGGASSLLGTEVVYNHYVNRLGIAMPQTKKLAERTRPYGIRHNGVTNLMWETLTHANNID